MFVYHKLLKIKLCALYLKINELLRGRDHHHRAECCSNFILLTSNRFLLAWKQCYR